MYRGSVGSKERARETERKERQRLSEGWVSAKAVNSEQASAHV